MSIKEKISADLKDAMKARDQVLVDTLRSAISAITYKHVESGKDLTTEDEIAVIQKQVKQRQDSIAEYNKAGRHELVEKETRERDILAKYLPPQKSDEEIRQLVRKTINSLDEKTRNQGSVMKTVMPQLKGTADGNLIKQIVIDELEKGNTL